MSLKSCDLVDTPTDTAQWTLEKLQAYIIHVKTLNPVTTEPANQLVVFVAPPPHAMQQGDVKILSAAEANRLPQQWKDNCQVTGKSCTTITRYCCHW